MVGMLKCNVLHTQMIIVLKQNERIPNVDRWWDSATHKYGGSPEVVVLVARFSIWLMGQQIQQERMRAIAVKGECYAVSLDAEQPFICARIACAAILEMNGYVVVILTSL